MDILHKTGIKVMNTDAVALFHGAGATVETFENHCIVKMSPYLVEQYLPMALSGGTSAATLSGTPVSHNAEVLSCIVLSQIVRQGVACTYGSCSTILDLKYRTGAVGSPEYAQLNAAAVDLAHYYSLPSFVGGVPTAIYPTNSQPMNLC